MTVYLINFGAGTDAALSWDSSTHRLGIGTSSPTQALDIVGTDVVKPRVSINSTDTYAYANWAADNGTGVALLGLGGKYYTNTLPGTDWSLLQNSGYALASPELNAMVVGNIGGKRTVFVMGDADGGYGNLVEIGSFNTQGGFDAGKPASEHATGTVNAAAGFAFNGTMGLSTTRGIGGVTMTIQGGLITAISS